MKQFAPFNFLFFVLHVMGQNAQSILPNQPSWLIKEAQLSFPTGNIPGTSSEDLATNAAKYLKSTINDLKNPNTDLVLTQNITSPYARYITFSQSFMGNEIYGTSIKIGIDNQHNIVSVIAKTGSVDNWPVNQAISDGYPGSIKTAIGNADHYDLKKVWFYTADAGIAGYWVNCIKMDGTRNVELILDQNYNIIYQNNLVKNYRYPDSLVTMYVFYPDPLTSAHHSYSEPFTNHHDSDMAQLDSQMKGLQIRVSILNKDSFFLENQYVIEKDLGPPYIKEFTNSKKPVFRFNRDTSAFRDLMIYYYITNWRNHLSDLGYDSLGNNQLSVDPNGEEDDQSTFYPPTSSTSGIIYFGLGGIPDAEDADIPTHEYTHFLSYEACHNCANQGLEREALDEGFGDYFAASLSKGIDTFGWQKVFNWDGNNAAEQWYGRSCAIADTYPAALNKFSFEKHLCGQLWSSALMQIWDEIGQTKTDKIMVESLYSMAGNITMTDAAKLYLKNDSLIYNYADRHVITNYFVARGFLPESASVTPALNEQIGYKINTSYFASANKVFFSFGIPQTGTFSLYDMTGKLIKTEMISNSASVEFDAPQLPDGIYILGVNTGGLQKSFKLLK